MQQPLCKSISFIIIFINIIISIIIISIIIIIISIIIVVIIVVVVILEKWSVCSSHYSSGTTGHTENHDLIWTPHVQEMVISHILGIWGNILHTQTHTHTQNDTCEGQLFYFDFVFTLSRITQKSMLGYAELPLSCPSLL